ncbi:MAG: GSU2403 family nucleotidyltransferase fold protein [bacterium]
MTDRLGRELIDLARVFSREDIPTVIAGGYGLVLKYRRSLNNDEDTIFTTLPGTRATADLDLFLTLEVISNPQKAEYIRTVLEEKGYEPVEGAENYQFVRALEDGRKLKVDLLTPALGESEELRVKAQRVRPQGASGTIHGRKVPEAFSLEANLQPLTISTKDGQQIAVHLPDPFTYYLLKLFALRDRLEQPEHAQRHAFDIYMDVGMMTEAEWEKSKELYVEHKSRDILEEARQITERLFGTRTSPGVKCLMEYGRSRNDMNLADERIDRLVKILNELFELG